MIAITPGGQAGTSLAAARLAAHLCTCSGTTDRTTGALPPGGSSVVCVASSGPRLAQLGGGAAAAAGGLFRARCKPWLPGQPAARPDPLYYNMLSCAAGALLLRHDAGSGMPATAVPCQSSYFISIVCVCVCVAWCCFIGSMFTAEGMAACSVCAWTGSGLPSVMSMCAHGTPALYSMPTKLRRSSDCEAKVA